MIPFFVWASQKNLSIAQLAERLGYSERQIYRLRDGVTSIHKGFIARAVMEFGDEVRPLFFDSASVKADSRQSSVIAGAQS